MLEIKDERLRSYVQDYNIHLISPEKLKEADFDKFKTDLGHLLHFIKYSEDKEQLDRLVHDDPSFLELNPETANMINVTTNLQIDLKEKDGVVDMCKAIEDMRRDSEEIGARRQAKKDADAIKAAKEEAKAAAKAAAERSLLEAIRNVMESFKVTKEQAMRALKVPVEEWSRYMTML